MKKTSSSNSRNGYTSKKVKTSFEESDLQVPRDRDTSFNPMLVSKHKNVIDGTETVIVSMYAKGMSVTDIEQQLKDIYNSDVSTSTVNDYPSSGSLIPSPGKTVPGASLPHRVDGWHCL